MKKACNNILEAIGNTPLVKLTHIAEHLTCRIYAKLEFVNPGGSIKDRVAKAMIEQAESEGLLKPGGTIIEATSGNTGVGLAMAAAVKGYRCIFIMPDKMSAEKIRLLKAYGAEVIITPTNAETNSPEGYGGVAARLVNEIPNSWQPNQFANLANPMYHYQTTGPEIWEQTEGKITTFVAGIGTGGTISGVGRFLKEKNPAVKIIGADPEGSILSGDKPKPWAVEGIGEDFVPKTFNSQMVDEWVRVSDAESFQVARSAARHEGMLIGGSCGTALAAGLKYGRRLGPNDLVVVLCPDTGRNYLSKMYSDEWMLENGYLESDQRTYSVGDLLDRRGPVTMYAVSPDDPVENAIGYFRQHGISQIPVIEDGKVVGGIREITVARCLHAGHDAKQTTIREVMARPMPQVERTTDVDEVYRLLMAGHSGVVVTKAGHIEGLIARWDLVDFWDSRKSEQSQSLTQPSPPT
jgi:cystathionine beta-synthase